MDYYVYKFEGGKLYTFLGNGYAYYLPEENFLIMNLKFKYVFSINKIKCTIL